MFEQKTEGSVPPPPPLPRALGKLHVVTFWRRLPFNPPYATINSSPQLDKPSTRLFGQDGERSLVAVLAVQLSAAARVRGRAEIRHGSV